MKGIGIERDCARRFRRSLMVPSRRDGAACPTGHASSTGHGAIVPGVWWYELRNALVMNERRGRLSSADTAATLTDLRQLRISIDQVHDEDVVVALAREHHLSVYDAAYIEVALRQTLPIASLDKRLRQAAGSVGVTILG